MHLQRSLSIFLLIALWWNCNLSNAHGSAGRVFNSPDAFYYPRSSPAAQQQYFDLRNTIPGKNSQKSNTNARNSYKELIKVYEARGVEFAFPSEAERNRVLKAGLYKPAVPFPIDVNVYYPSHTDEPTVFMTIPRFVSGVPFSLGILTDIQGPNGPQVRAYPSYDWHVSHGQDCNGLTSAFRSYIDPCGKMWIIDSGEININHLCPPQIIAIDIKNAKLVYRYRLPHEMYKTNTSRLVNFVVDFEDPPPLGSCHQAFVYMADPVGAGLVVIDVVRNRSWRIENKYTFPDPDFSNHTIDGTSFELLDGVFGLTVTPHGLGLQRMLYFHALSHDLQVAVPLSAINNETLWPLKNPGAAIDKFIPLGRRGVQCATSVMTPHGFILCGLLEPIGIMSWNIRTPYTADNLVLLAENRVTLQFVSGLKVIKNPKGRYDVWMLSNRLQYAFQGTINSSEINYRIQKCGLDEMLLGTACRD